MPVGNDLGAMAGRIQATYLVSKGCWLVCVVASMCACQPLLFTLPFQLSRCGGLCMRHSSPATAAGGPSVLPISNLSSSLAWPASPPFCPPQTGQLNIPTLPSSFRVPAAQLSYITLDLT